MKKIIALLVIGLFIMIGCEKEPENNEVEVNTFVSVNVKDGLTDYFQFESNNADTLETVDWDIAFTAEFWSPMPGVAPEIWDPFIIAHENISVACVEVTELSEVTEVPAEDSFAGDFTTFEDRWYETDDNNIVQPLDYVYIVVTSRIITHYV